MNDVFIYLCLSMKSPLFFIRFLVFTAILCSCSSSKTPSKKILLDEGWTFQLTDDSGRLHDKELVDLPHDWSIMADFNENAPGGNDGGYLPSGKGHYSRILKLSPQDEHKVNRLLFEGVYMNSIVVVNGDTVGKQPYGYSSFIYDISPYVKAGENLIEVFVDNSHQKNSRWYSGSGIYRHVWLLTTGKVNIEPWSLAISSSDISHQSANVNVKAFVNDPDKDEAEVTFRISREDELIAEKTVKTTGGEINETISISEPQLWSPETPALYNLEIAVSVDGSISDIQEESFGIRKFEFSAENGLKLNGEPIILNGGCVHHDNGILGARSYDAAEARKVRLLKEAGFNAVRTSHNPPSPEFLYECDRQGLIVIDEAFDGWRESKTDYDYATVFDSQWQKDIAAMVKRDRNHPSVFAWSIGNEILERKSPEAVQTAHQLAELCRELDPTRPVTSALAAWDADWEIYDPLAAEHDIVGYNYMIHKAEGDHVRVPDRVMWQTESFPRDAFQNWVAVNDHPYVIGDFVWTAIDYLGESGIGRHYYEGESEGEHFHRNQWPWHGALCGDIDLTGFRKPISHYREILYSPVEKIYMAVREPDGYKGKIKETMWGTYPTYESWSWPSHEGKNIDVEVYSNYPEVELSLNDSIIGRQSTGRENEFKAIFTIPYAPGILKARAFGKDGSAADEFVLTTSGEPYQILLTPDKQVMSADNADLVFVVAEIFDSNGIKVPNAEVVVDFAVDGDADIIATGSADMKDTKGYYHTKRKTSGGRAMAVVKANKKPGEILIKATSPGLSPADVAIISH